MEDHHPAVLTGHIGDDLSGLVITDDGSLRDLDDKIIPIGAVAALFAAGLAVLRAVLPLMAEIHQRIQAVADLENDVAAPAGITINDMVNNGSIYSYYGGSVSGKTITYDSAISGTNTIYYPLATPTYEEITGELLSQLEALAYSYEGTTNISQENDDLAFVLDITALKEMS